MYAYPFKNCMNTCRTYFTTLYIEYAPTLIRDPICSELPLPGGDLSMTLVQQCTHLRILRQILSFSSGFFAKFQRETCILVRGRNFISSGRSPPEHKNQKKSPTRFPKKFNKKMDVQKPKKSRPVTPIGKAGKNRQLSDEVTEDSCPALVLALTSARCSNRKPEGHKSQRFDGG